MSCSGTGDDTAGVVKAFAAARQAAFTLVVDCPVNLKIGSDISKPVFIDNGTTVEFSGAGKFTVDNNYIPAFVIANSSNINLVNWNVEYVGGLSIADVNTYENNGATGTGKPGNMFNDVMLTQWLAANRAITFDKTQGVNSVWPGTTNACGVFYFTGDTSNVLVTGMHLYVPAGAAGNHFIPVAFTLAMNFKSAQRLSPNLPASGQFYAIPHNITFSNIVLDGTYMGFVGGLSNSVFENITSLRYGDLQDANGNNVGGIGKWFAPPHLFYFNYPTTAAAALFNTNVQIKNVTDNGIRVGKARDTSTENESGYADSLKLGCVNCSVDTYTSNRPDGLMDVLESDGLTITNVTGTYNSAFTNNIYPGMRFPSPTYTNFKMENVTLTDLAPRTVMQPIGNAGDTTNSGMAISNVTVALKEWAGANKVPYPNIAGKEINTQIKYTMQNTGLQENQVKVDAVETELAANPATIRAGESTTVSWLSRQASSCSGAGEWSGVSGTTGSKTIKLTSPGTYNFTVECRNSGTTSTNTVSVNVSS